MNLIAQLKTERDKAARQVEALDTVLKRLRRLNWGERGLARRRRRRLSAAGRASIAAAQKARWVPQRGSSKRTATSRALSQP